ncbi:polygalacturonase-like [Ananas comosus]|uniref:Exopolygalacturonase n=1 Tax=Ananas comosus TaxID=4615 RepID=A0A6P5EFK2_ANACO|nr:polygalacturonase-like [Ananas comosus]
MAQSLSLLSFLLLFSYYSTLTMGAYNVLNYGAEPDGQTDSAKAFLSAWADACGSGSPATMYVPAGNFFVSQAVFQGPCKSSEIKMYIDGTVVASSSYDGEAAWLMFKYVDGLSIFGGTIDGQGRAFWACKTAGRSCPSSTTSLTIAKSNNILISGLSTVNSKGFHISIFGSNGVTVQGTKITAPGNSPNTDGIHIQMSSDVTVTSSSIKTGDDCISIGEGANNVWIEKINCGPGHGISIGSLGDTPSESGVQNITVTSVVFTGTQNGLRIKTWGKPYSGFVKDVKFEHAVMQNVQNPIIVDQNYCPGDVNCPDQSSGIKISGLAYTDIQGTSATQLAVKFDCSSSNPCSGITMQDIKLTYQNQNAQSYCKNAGGSTSGFIIPPSCL